MGASHADKKRYFVKVKVHQTIRKITLIVEKLGFRIEILGSVFYSGFYQISLLMGGSYLLENTQLNIIYLPEIFELAFKIHQFL